MLEQFVLIGLILVIALPIGGIIYFIKKNIKLQVESTVLKNENSAIKESADKFTEIKKRQDEIKSGKYNFDVDPDGLL